jgi:hypothetical protein
MKSIARLPSSDRHALFANTAEKTGLTIAIIEKDFWVCWMLGYLFHRCKWKKHFSFKGGTSLSKAFHLIERFSEDIDLILDWRLLGYGADEPWEDRSNTKQESFNKEANRRTVDFLQNELAPVIRSDAIADLGVDIQIKADEEDGQTLLFTYPQGSTDHSIAQNIRLEVGVLAAWSPSDRKDVKSYAAENYAPVFAEPTTSVR